MTRQTPEPLVPLIEQAAKRMAADPDSRWHAVATLLLGGPISYARLLDGHPNRERMLADYPDAPRAAEVARAYLSGAAGVAEGNHTDA
jgi:hypothetical protein